MSATVTKRRPRGRVAALAGAPALAAATMLALAVPASADANMSFVSPPATAVVSTAYSYTISTFNGWAVSGGAIATITVTLSGSAATFTNATITNDSADSCTISGATATCAILSDNISPAIDSSIVVTVLPTATGTAIAEADATFTSSPAGPASDTTSTTITAPAFPFTGFLSPVQNPPTLNQVHAGQAIPMKFSLGGDQGLSIFAGGSPTATQVDCSTDAPINTSTLTDTSGNSGLQFDSSTDDYTYVWKTSKSWSGTCQEFTMTLTDGTSHSAIFQFK